jgi:site-specific DNA recombinase
VEIWYYADRSRVDTRTALTRGMLSMKATFAAAEREAAQSRTREALRSKAQRGHVAGGVCYGYKNVRTGDHVEREIIPAEAAIIRRIFAEIAQGRGYAVVAKGLNADAVRYPRGRCWAMTGVREMVFRDLYRGRVVYGKTTWDYRKGRKFKIAAPESAWIIREDPRLRIVDEDLWKAAHARLDRTRQTYLRRTGGTLWGRPEAGIEARHLLSGFVVCGTCGGAMHAIRRTGRRGRPKIYYTCNNWRVNGACANRLSLTVSELDRVVVETIRKYVLTPEIVEDVITRAIELYASEADVYAERRERLTAEAERLQAEATRFTEAIRLGGPLVMLVAELKSAEQRRADVLAQLEHLEGLAKAPAWDDKPPGGDRATAQRVAATHRPRARGRAPATPAAPGRAPEAHAARHRHGTLVSG